MSDSEAQDLNGHGTYAGMSRHNADGTPPCDECKEARRQYARDRRATSDKARQYDRTYMRAVGRATQRLKEMFPAQFYVLLAEERSGKDSGTDRL